MTFLLSLLAGNEAKLAAMLAALGAAVVLVLHTLGNARRSGVREQQDKDRQQRETAYAAARKAVDDVAGLDDAAVVKRLHSEYDTRQ